LLKYLGDIFSSKEVDRWGSGSLFLNTHCLDFRYEKAHTIGHLRSDSKGLYPTECAFSVGNNAYFTCLKEKGGL